MKVRFPEFKLFRKLFGLIGRVLDSLKESFRTSLRVKLIITFALCLTTSMLVFKISNIYLARSYRYQYIDYNSGIRDIDDRARNIVENINYLNDAINKEAKDKGSQESKDYANPEDELMGRTQEFINDQADNLKIMIVDLDGRVLLKSQNVDEIQIDVFSILKNVMNASRGYEGNSERIEFTSFYPVNLKSKKAYLIVKGIPEGRIVTRRTGTSPFSLIAALAAFVLLFLYLTKKKIKYIEELENGLIEISSGNLDFRVEEKSEDELGSLARNINFMAQELNNTIEEERRAEKTKNELITNVSHDLRTPLTSIMGYLGLVRDRKFESEEQLQEFINIAFTKSEKLKSLIEDLFEYTKLNNEGIKLNKSLTGLNEFLDQLVEELIPIGEENSIEIETDIPRERITVNIDADKMLRVFENLIVNGIKYSRKPGKVKVNLWREGDSALVCIENKGEAIPSEELPKLFDRFYRMEKSRSSNTGGSGLGLAIAKSIVILHKGDIWAECQGDTIKFFVKIKSE